MGYFNLPFGVRVSNNQPLDGDRYVAIDLAARDSLITNGRAYEGLQVYIESGDTANTGLWLLTDLGVDIISTTWTKIDGMDLSFTNLQSGDTLVYSGGTWVNSAVTFDDTYTTGLTINTLGPNLLELTLTDGRTLNVDLGYLVDTDSYVCGGTYDPRSGGTIDFVTNSGYSFAVSGISNASIDSLSDVSLSSTTNGQVLVYSGGTWYNSSVTYGADDWIDADIIPTKEVGGISIGETQVSGTTFEEIFRHILAPTIDAYISSTQHVTITGVATSMIEIGEYFTMTLGNTFDNGVIKSQENYPTESDVDLVGNVTSASYSGPGSDTSGDVAYSATTGTMSWTVNVDYASGVSNYYDSDGNIAHNLDASRVSGSTSNSNTRIGRYKYWYGVSGSSMSSDSDAIRNGTLTNAFDTEGNLTFNITIPATDQYVGFYLRKDITDDADITVTYVESSNADVTSTFTPSDDVTIKDGGGNDITYRRYMADTNVYGEIATYHVVVVR